MPTYVTNPISQSGMPTSASLLLFRRVQQEMLFRHNLERQANAQKLLDYYDGKQLEHLEDELAEQFGDPTALLMQPAMDNITRFIADEVSMVFDSPPTLSCDNAAGQALLDSLTDDGMLAITLKLAEVYSNITGVVALHSYFDMRTNKIKTIIIPSSCLFVAQYMDDPTEAEAVVYSRIILDSVTNQELVEYVHWDSESCFVFDAVQMGVYRPPSGTNPDMVNPYGIIPFAFLRDSLPVGTFFTPGDDGLINAQENLNVLLTSANQLAKMQGFAQPVLTGNFKAENPIVVDPSRPIRFPPAQAGEQPSSFQFISPASHIADIMAQISNLIERAIVRRGISITAVNGQSSAISGYALKIANSRLERKRVDSLPLARQALIQWWEIVKRIHNTHFSVGQVPLSAELNVDFCEPTYQDDPKALLDADILKIANGLSSPIEVMMRDDPDLDEAAAIAKYEQNLKYKPAPPPIVANSTSPISAPDVSKPI